MHHKSDELSKTVVSNEAVADLDAKTQELKTQELKTQELKTQELLGQALQKHYEDLVNAPIPDRFLLLLAELEAKEKREGEAG